ncbi:MAG TPA: hypothetical protein VF230_06315 [Acidimicrobiales bacterium]
MTSAACFLALARAAVRTPHDVFRVMSLAMAASAGIVMLVSPAAGAALLAPVFLSRRMANQPVPATVPALLDRYPRRSSSE